MKMYLEKEIKYYNLLMIQIIMFIMVILDILKILLFLKIKR